MAKELIYALIEPEILARIESEREHESRSSYVRRILVRWYNGLDGKEQVKE